MKSNSWTNKEDDSISRFEEFLVKLCATTNMGIHNDLDNSQDYLGKHEVQDYIDTKRGLDITAIEKAVKNDELSVHDVVEIGIHWARHTIHKNWHEVMDDTAREFGVEPPDMGEHGVKPRVQVITDPSQLPKEVRDVLTDVIGDILKEVKKKKGKK